MKADQLITQVNWVKNFLRQPMLYLKNVNMLFADIDFEPQ